MTAYVAFLRAINVGGRVVKMDRLRDVLVKSGLSEVRTYIASGNVLFESAASAPVLEQQIAATLAEALGYEVATFIRTPLELARLAASRPFGRSDPPQATVFVGFLHRAPTAAARRAVLARRTAVDDLRVAGREVFWLASRGFAAAELSPARLEKTLGCPVTFRNVTTVRQMAALAQSR